MRWALWHPAAFVRCRLTVRPPERRRLVNEEKATMDRRRGEHQDGAPSADTNRIRNAGVKPTIRPELEDCSNCRVMDWFRIQI
jgi:hypothetical protein